MRDRGGVVVLADPHQSAMESIRSVLITLFDSIVMVADEESLLHSVTTLRPDIVVIDPSLPVSCDRNAITLLHGRCPDANIIAVSVHEGREFADACVQSGALAHVVKRKAVRDLPRAVKEVRTYGYSFPVTRDGAAL